MTIDDIECFVPTDVIILFLFTAFGELVLQEKKEMREMKQRLMEIEEQLQRFQNEDHNEVSWRIFIQLALFILDKNSQFVKLFRSRSPIISSVTKFFPYYFVQGILSESLLRQLIDDNSRTTSQATTILDSISSTSYDTTSSFDKTSVISSVASTPRSEQ